MELNGKKVLVFGAGISGIGAVCLLEKKGASVVLYDGKESLKKEEVRKKLPEDSRAEIIIGELPKAMLNAVDLLVMSPGIPVDTPVVTAFREHHIPVWGEIELAYRVGSGTVLAITGTNGKTTTTALLGHIMKAWSDNVFVAGNIGVPYTSVALNTDKDSYIVAEVSSFQLETIDTFAPKVSAVLNIAKDHLNRHHTMEEYIRVKERIVENQSFKDVCVLNYEDEVLRAFGKNIVPQVLFFSSLRTLNRGVYLENDQIILKMEQEEIPIAKTEELKLLGRHNYENVMAAVAMAYSTGVPIEIIRSAVREFEAVEHRIEYVTEKNGVAYYNDSKATNPEAAIQGIQAMNRPTLLIGGGYDKGADYDEWLWTFENKVRYLVLIGQTREKIAKAAHECGFESIILADSLKEAVSVCAVKAHPGDAVLLSPACASWGQFDNYEQRGKLFKEFVHSL